MLKISNFSIRRIDSSTTRTILVQFFFVENLASIRSFLKETSSIIDSDADRYFPNQICSKIIFPDCRSISLRFFQFFPISISRARRTGNRLIDRDIKHSLI